MDVVFPAVHPIIVPMPKIFPVDVEAHRVVRMMFKAGGRTSSLRVNETGGS